MSEPRGEWSDYQKLVLAELKRLSREVISMDHKVSREMKALQENYSRIQVEIAMLKVKSGAWGGIAGIVGYMASHLIRHSLDK